jgi:hypothetical protein
MSKTTTTETKKPKKSQAPTLTKAEEEIVEALRREIRTRLGPGSTFEERRDAGLEIMQKVLWRDGDADLQGSITDVEEINVGGKKYRRMEQPSAGTYFGRFGSHYVVEPLYREVGVHNGPTIKPIELCVGIVEHMTPDMARVVGALSAESSSRTLERTLRTVGHAPPSRAFLADRTTKMGAMIADDAAALEDLARTVEVVPANVASVSCGLDRMSVRMSELSEPDSDPPPARAEPYERTRPPPKEHHYRKAWVGSTSVYDAEGNELKTWRVAAEADADPAKFADRVAEEVAWILKVHPKVPVHCVQDAAPELRALPEALERALPVGKAATVVELVDFEHLMGYLDDVVDACEPVDDPHDMKRRYRGQLLEDDGAIDRIERGLREKGQALLGHNTTARNAVAAALRYIKRRKHKMRYARHYAANLPIGSGATESTCWQMQQRVKLPGQSWEPCGLSGVLAVRGLVLSGRWDAAWQPYAAEHRMEIRVSH